MKRFLRSILWKFNYDIVKLKPKYRHGAIDKEEVLKQYKWFQDLNFETIIDIGANEGQFSEKMRSLFPNAFIYLFEPLPEPFQLLKKNFRHDKKVQLFQKGCGAERGSFKINYNESSASSSLLPMTKEHTDHFTEAIKTTEIEIEIDTIDNILHNVHLSEAILVKMDVQGFEDKVIAGGQEILKKADMIICELSFFELYKGQPLFGEIYKLLTELGFDYAGSIEQLYAPDSNKILQQDGIFIKSANSKQQ